MKKQLKDVTIGEMVEQCRINDTEPYCNTCPLFDFCSCTYPKGASEKMLEAKIDLKEEKE